jgi:glycerol-3-phosphate dehydrogenase
MDLDPKTTATPTAPAQQRSLNVDRLPGGVFDVLAIGAGINGAVSAASLAARGASVALVDRGDFASLTSQESSNLVWGGIKYLENSEFRLVWKLCRSRNRLVRNYPTNVTEIRFFAPIEKRPQGFKRTLPALYCGTWLYWLMGGGATRIPRFLSVGRIAREEPIVETSIMRGGIEYSDAYLIDNDARFVLGFVHKALELGAAVANYVEVLESCRDASGIWNTRAVDRITGSQFTIRSRVLLNTAGPYVDSLNENNGVPTRARHLFSKGIHLIVRRLTDNEHVLTFFDDTNRMFFVIPMGHRSVVGTTDTPVDTPRAQVTAEDRQFLFDNLNKRLRLDPPLSDADVISERCGVRPLAVEGSSHEGETEWLSLSRKHIIDIDRDRKHISVFGGKLTDCLNVGEGIAEAVGDLGIALRTNPARWFGEPAKALRREFAQRARRMGLDQGRPSDYETLSERLWRRYGKHAFGLLEDIARDPRLAEPIIEGTQYRHCELHFAARSEMIVKLEDFLRRRTKIALLICKEELHRAHGLKQACEILFGDQAGSRYDEYFA